MRVFISIDIPQSIKDKIMEVQSKLPEFEGKLTEEGNFHLTLKFLGEVNNKQIEKIKSLLKEIKFPQFETKLSNLGFFDNLKSSKYKQRQIIWISMTNCEKLQKLIDEKLKGLFKKEQRFMGHLTIARLKKLNNKNLFLKNLVNISIPEISFKVKHFELKQSTLREKGPKYITLEQYNLI